MTIKRIASSFAFFILIILSILNEWICGIAVTLLIFGGLVEFFNLVEKKGIPIYKYFGTAVGIIIPLSILFRFELTKNWELLFIVLALVFLFLLQFTRRDNSQSIFGISTTLFGILYVSGFSVLLLKLGFYLTGEVC